MKHYCANTFLFILSLLPLQAQIGINTETPSATFEVVSSGTSVTSKAFVLSNSDDAETMLVRNDGRIGIGTTSPLVKLDLRSPNANQESIIGIGYTNLAASVAGGGAIRYNPTLQVFEYSNGVEWLSILENVQEKALVIAQNDSQQAFSPATATIMTNWTVNYNNETNTFNATTGEFTAPRDGIYSITATAVFEATDLDAGGQHEIQIYPLFGQDNILKSLVPILSEISPIRLSNFNKGMLRMEAGQSVAIRIYITKVDDAKLASDGTLTTLTISEL